MWFFGAVLGFFIGGATGDGFGAVVWALVGGVAGHYLSRRLASQGDEMLASRLDGLEQVTHRVASLEAEVARLRREVDQLRGGAVLPAAEGVPEAVAPVADEPAPVVALAPAPAVIKESVPVPPGDAVPVPEPASARSEPAPPADDGGRPIEVPGWLARLAGGNPLAKIGVVLLFFGVASGLRLAIQYGLFPVWLRLALAAGAGAGLIGFGFRKAQDATHRGFGLALQGGGFALLYLVAYFMLARYGMIDKGLAFALFALLGVGCVALAARQDGPALAVLGISGAFLAPVLAGGRSDSPLPLFSYFALLNVFVLGVNWFKAWRSLNIAGFVFTLLIGMAWGVDRYQHSHYLVTQAFVVLFVAAYSAMPVATALLRAPGLAAWHEGILLFGTPLAGVGLQLGLVGDTEYGLAWSAFVGAGWYFLLAGLLWRRKDPANSLIELAHWGIATALLTISVPLAFGAQLTSALWALEGCAVLWLGVRSGRPLVQGVGLMVQVLAGGALLLDWSVLPRHLPVANDAVLGAFLLTASGLFSAQQLRRLASPAVTAWGPLVWALAWWLGCGVDEIRRFAPTDLQAPIGLAFVTATVLGLEGLVRLWRWPALRAWAILLLGAMLASALLTFVRSGHPLAAWMALVLPLAFGVHGALLRLEEASCGALPERSADDLPPQLIPMRHLGSWWLLVWLVPAELGWQVEQAVPGVDLWPWVIWTLAAATALAGALLGRARGWWPFASPLARYVPLGIAPLVVGLVLLLVDGNSRLSGWGSGLPYVPVLSVFDVTQGIGVAALWFVGGQLGAEQSRLMRLGVVALAFVWLSALAARIAHHFGGVPFELDALLASTLFQAVLTLFWTVTAIAAMIHASRRRLRMQWFAGFGLLAVVGAKLLLFDASGRGTVTWTLTLLGVALLVLAASYFAPLPPRASSAEAGGGSSG